MFLELLVRGLQENEVTQHCPNLTNNINEYVCILYTTMFHRRLSSRNFAYTSAAIAKHS